MNSGWSDAQVASSITNFATWKRLGTFAGLKFILFLYFLVILLIFFFSFLPDASCPRCCPHGEPIVKLTYGYCSQQHGGNEEAYTFQAKPRCTSTRHQGAKVMLVISGIPFLTKPLISVPITLHARGKHNSHTDTFSFSNSTENERKREGPYHSMTVVHAQSPQVRTETRFPKEISYLPVCVTVEGALPPSVLATASPVSVAIPASSFSNNCVTVYRSTHT